MVHGNSESGIELESMVQTRASTNGINLLSIEKQAVLPKSRRSGQDDSMTLPPENSFELVFAPLLKDDLGKLKEEFYRKFGQSDTFFSMNNSRPHGLSQDEQKDWEEQLKLLKEELKILKTIDPQRKSSEFATVYLRLGIAEHLVSDGRSELAGEHLDRAVDLLKDGPADKLAVALMRMSEDLIVKDSHRDLWQQREGVRRIPEEAVELLVKAQEAAEKSPLKGQTEHGLILSDLGLINFNREEYAAAEKYLEKATTILRKIAQPGSDRDLGAALIKLGVAKHEQGKDGTKEFDEYIALMGKEILPLDLADVLLHKGDNVAKLGKPEKAKTIYEEALLEIKPDDTSLDGRITASRVLKSLTRVELKLMKPELAEKHSEEAIEKLNSLFKKPEAIESLTIELGALKLLNYQAIAAQGKDTTKAAASVNSCFERRLDWMRENGEIGPDSLRLIPVLESYKEALTVMKETAKAKKVAAEIERIGSFKKDKPD